MRNLAPLVLAGLLVATGCAAPPTRRPARRSTMRTSRCGSRRCSSPMPSMTWRRLTSQTSRGVVTLSGPRDQQGRGDEGDRAGADGQGRRRRQIDAADRMQPRVRRRARGSDKIASCLISCCASAACAGRRRRPARSASTSLAPISPTVPGRLPRSAPRDHPQQIPYSIASAPEETATTGSMSSWSRPITRADGVITSIPFVAAPCSASGGRQVRSRSRRATGSTTSCSSPEAPASRRCDR